MRTSRVESLSVGAVGLGLRVMRRELSISVVLRGMSSRKLKIADQFGGSWKLLSLILEASVNVVSPWSWWNCRCWGCLVCSSC